MNTDRIEATYRRVDRRGYPELDGYAWADIYRDVMGPGGLFLAVQMARTMDLHPGDIVLDLGCGRGETCIWLAKHFGVHVVAVDLWTSATYLDSKFTARGYRRQIVPLHLDVTKELPFAEAYFDAIFCMNSLSFYGGSVGFLRRLLKHLKPQGMFCVGSECFDQEFTPEQATNPPEVFAWEHPEGGSVWEGDFSRQHSPSWWADLFRSSGLLDVLICSELEDSLVLLEDKVLHDIVHDVDPQDTERTIAQIEYGRSHSPHQTLFRIAGQKRGVSV
jgi:SAM-dependent methyltransferase